jgi:hypothetical protein
MSTSMTTERSRRERYWPEVEQYFGNLSPELFRLGLLLKNHLTVRYAGTGQLQDILRRAEDYPLLSLPFWLLDDLGVAEGQARARLEQPLFLALFFSLATVQVHESLFDPETGFDQRFVFLEQSLVQRETLHWAQLFRQDDPFWTYHRMFWQEYAEANLWEAQRPAHMLAAAGEGSCRRSAGRLAPAKLPVVAVAFASGHQALLPRLLEMIDGLNRIFQTRREILSLRRDLSRGAMTYPIVRTLAAAGLPIQAPAAPEQVLGAMLLTGSIRAICQESLADLERCREIARELSLPTWLAYFDTVEAITRELLSLFSLGAPGSPPPPAAPLHAAFLPAHDTLADAIKRAEGYLLSDLTFRESWEVQRYVIPGSPEATCRAFPSGLILEVLCASGHGLAGQVDEVFSILQSHDFRYYDTFRIPPDADDLGLLLRLYRYAGRQSAHQDALQRPLRWMERNVLPSGEIPVYFTEDVDTAIDPRNVWATHCLSVEINLLLGLIDYDWQRYEGLVERAMLALFDRLLKNGLGLTTNYDLLYALWALARLIERLSALEVGAAVRDQMGPASAAVRDRLAQAAVRRLVSPQDAAFLTLACQGGATGALFDPRWITVLLRNQRFDGSWEAEPFYPTPNRGGVPTWYASRTITTAYCYHALQTFRRRMSS